MVEVVRVARAERPKRPEDHVLVEAAPDGSVRATGARKLNGDVARYAPPPFHNIRVALVAATAWADQHGVGTVHLCADDSTLLDDCASLEVLAEEAEAKTVEQAAVVRRLPEGLEKLEAERVLDQMRQNEASIDLNRSLNDCD